MNPYGGKAYKPNRQSLIKIVRRLIFRYLQLMYYLLGISLQLSSSSIHFIDSYQFNELSGIY